MMDPETQGSDSTPTDPELREEEAPEAPSEKPRGLRVRTGLHAGITSNDDWEAPVV
jgi:hypothetical protein